jgi:hypothetical protein
MRPEESLVRRHFQGAPEPSPELRQRLRARLEDEWQGSSTAAPAHMKRSRKPSARRAWVVGGCVATVLTAGTGLAAATGAFGSSQAESALIQSSRIHRAEIATTTPPPTVPASGLSATTLVPTTPAATTPPTTTANGVTKPGSQQLVLSEPGPDGMTIELWTAPEAPTGVCFVLETSDPGAPTAPGKPSLFPWTYCLSYLAQIKDQISGLSGALWQDAAGHRYLLSVGHVQVVGAVKLSYTCPGAITGTTEVQHDWYVLAIPGDNGGPCQATAFDANGTEVATSLHA